MKRVLFIVFAWYVPLFAAAQNLDVTGSSFTSPRGASTQERHLWLPPSGSRFQRDSPARRPLPLWALPPAAAALLQPPTVVNVPPPAIEVNVPPAAPAAQASGEQEPERWVIEPVRPEGPDRFAMATRPQPAAPARWVCRAKGEQTKYVVSTEKCSR